MADLFARPGSDKWQAYCWYYAGGARRRVAKSTGIRNDGSAKSRERAQIIADQIERDLALGGEARRRPSKTIRQALAALTEAAELAGHSDDTLKNIMYRGQRLADEHGLGEKTPLSELDADRLRAYAIWSRGQGRGAWTVTREFQLLGQLYGIAGVKPPEFPDLGDIKHKPQRVLELDEQRALLLATPPERRLNVLAYLQLGLRLSEPGKITEVDWAARYVHVAGTKTEGSKRDVPIPDELFEHMLPRRGFTPVLPEWHGKCVDRVLRRTSLRAIGEAISVNDLRGTYATHMARAGVPILTLAKIMGNSVAMLEQIYAQVGKRGDHLQQAASKLPRITKAQPKKEGTGT